MGFILDAILKRITDTKPWIQSTVRAVDANNSIRNRPVDFSGLIARYVSVTYSVADRNATALASVPCCLYRPAKARSARMYRGRKVVNGDLEYLRSPGKIGTVGVGGKAARYARMAGDVEEVLEHPVLELLADPNQWDNASLYLHNLWVNLQLCGNAYDQVIVGDRTSEPVQLLDLEPQWTRVLKSRTDFIDGYVYGRNREIEKTFAPDEIIHHRWAKDPQDPWYGRGPLKAVIVEHDMVMAVNQANLTLFDNGARPDWAITTEVPMPAEQTDRFRAQIEAAFKGVGKTGRFLIIPTGTSIEPLRFNPKDLADQEVQKRMQSVICNAFGIPEVILSMSDATFANADAALATWARNTIMPRASSYCATLTERLLPMYGIEPGEMWFAPENILPEDEQGKTTVLVAQVNSAIITTNEARADLGLESLDNGDVLRFNGMPVDSMSFGAFGSGLVPGQLPEAEQSLTGEEAPALVEGGGTADQTTAQASRDFNGAQVTSAVAILQGVTDGSIAPDAAVLMLVEFFGMDQGRAQSMVNAQSGRREEIEDDNESARQDAASQQRGESKPTEDETEEDAEEEKGLIVLRRHGRTENNGRYVRVHSPQEMTHAHAGNDRNGTAAGAGLERQVDHGADPREPADDDGQGHGDPGDETKAERAGACACGRADCACAEAHADADSLIAEAKQLDPDSPYQDRPDIRMYFEILDWFADWKNEILRAMSEAPRGLQARRLVPKANIPDELIELVRLWGIDRTEQKAQELRERLLPYVTQSLKVGARTGFDEVRALLAAAGSAAPEPLEGFGLSSERAQNYIQTYQSRFLRDMNEVSQTTAKRVADALVDGLDKGYGIDKLKDSVRESFDAVGTAGETISEVRASAIARTESAKATDAGRIAGWESMDGVVKGKTWLLAPNACEFCRTAHKQFGATPIPLTDAFYPLGSTVVGDQGGVMQVDYEPIVAGNLHPNCRCSVNPVLIGETP